MPDNTAEPRTNSFEALSPVLTHLHSGYLVRAALELGLPDQVDDAGSTVDEIAERIQADPASLRRLLRALSTIGVFQPAENDRFQHTTTSSALRSTAGSNSMLNTFTRSEWSTRMWEQLPEAVRTGEAAFPKVMGKPLYDYLDQDAPDTAADFNAAMTRLPGSSNESVAGALDLSSSADLVDVGGGQGTLLRTLLEQNPHLHGTLFDIGHALVDVDDQLRTGDVSDRCRLVEGDARETVPAGADAYVFRMILHNWDDESCVRMLRNCAREAKSGARVLIVEIVLPENGEVSTMTAMMDMMMFVLFGSNERTTYEYAALFERAGLEFAGVTETSSEFSIVEAKVP